MFIYENVEKNLSYDMMEFVRRDALEQARIFLRERNNAFIVKEIEELPFPYSQHRIVGNFRFTNLKRELDVISKNLNNMIQDLSLKDKLLNIIWYRCFRIVRNTQYLDFLNGDKNSVNNIIKKSDETNNKSLGSYLISIPNRCLSRRCGDDFVEYMRIMSSKYFEFFLKEIPELFARKIPYEKISKNPEGIGRFFIYQVFLDLAYQKEFPMNENDFIISGPGCDFGLKCLFPNYSKVINSEELLVWVWKNSNVLFDVNDWNRFFIKPKNLTYYHDGFTLANVENFFCEFGKYWKIFNNEKCRKRTYKPQN